MQNSARDVVQTPAEGSRTALKTCELKSEFAWQPHKAALAAAGPIRRPQRVPVVAGTAPTQRPPRTLGPQLLLCCVCRATACLRPRCYLLRRLEAQQAKYEAGQLAVQGPKPAEQRALVRSDK